MATTVNCPPPACDTAASAQLLQECLQSKDERAWEEFVSRYKKPIALVVLRVARQWSEPSTSIVDDLVQDTFLKLCDEDCRILRDFRSEESEGLTGYLKVIAANLAQDHFRSVHARKRGAGLTLSTLQAIDLIVTSSMRAAETAVLVNEIDTFLEKSCSAKKRDQAVFWLYYREGMTANAIASVPAVGLTTKGVESVIRRLTEQVRSRFTLPAVRDKKFDFAEGI